MTLDTGFLQQFPQTAIPSGYVDGITSVNKFGRSTNVDTDTDTDIWDGANASDDIDIWVAPTQARTHAIVSTDATDVCGIQTLTLTGQPLDTETVTIGTKVYTFQTTLTDVDGNVKIGASASASLDNLIAAINLAAGAGSTYAASMTANSVSVVAAAGVGDTMTLWDQASTGAATTETLTNGSWGAATTVAGVGARTIRVYGLTSWDTKETYEDVVLHGDVSVSTVNSYVIIHRMKVLTNGSSGPNAGVISATAATDSTLTAQINAGEGQTQMAIYGVPSVQDVFIVQHYASANRAVTAVVNTKLLINSIPDSDLTGFVTKYTGGLNTAGNVGAIHTYNPYSKFSGPCIIKMQGNSSANNTDVSAGFDLILVDNQ